MRLTINFLFVFVLSFSAFSQNSIIPKPVTVQPGKGTFSLTPSTKIVLEGSGTENSVNFFNWYLKEYYGFELATTKNHQVTNTINLNFERMDNELPGAYNLEVTKNSILIAGDNEEGVFYAIQSLIQLLPLEKKKSLAIPQVRIEDAPRFAYRGLHLDVGRHFFPVAFVKKYIDFIAMHKMNYFHWHLTEDQGWRIEIKKYPALTTIGAWRNGTLTGRYPGTGNDNTPYGGFYTQDEIKDVVDYATKRYITIVPEIEMPGHSSAAIAAYPWLSCFPDEPTKSPTALSIGSQRAGGKFVQETWGVFDDVYCAGKDSTFQFLQDVMDEVIALFPSKYIHVGGDESPKTNWKRCPQCQQRMKNEKLNDEHQLQSYFIQRMEKYLNTKGRTLMGWDEILEGGLAPKAMVMSWRGEEGGIAAAKEKHNVIMTPGAYCYLDHSQSQSEDSVTIGGYLPIEKVYAYEPVPAALNALQAKYILGAQGNLWTEYITNESKVEYMILPRLSALSEVLWSAKAKRNWTDFEKRLPIAFQRYDLWKAGYSTAYYNIKTSIAAAPAKNGLTIKFETKDRSGKLTYGITGQHFQKNYTAPLIINGSSEVTCLYYRNNKLMDSVTINLRLNKATGKKIMLVNQPSPNYPGDGPFTLINGIQNEKGMTRSVEFLGFNGTDCEAVIDLGAMQNISNVKVHTFQQPGSWIYPPKGVEVFSSADGKTFTSVGKTGDVSTSTGNGIMEINVTPASIRYLRVAVQNWGKIGEGSPGAGNPAWLFLDEIEVN